MLRFVKGFEMKAFRSTGLRVRSAQAHLSSEKLYKGNGTLGVVREEYGMWERRAPLSPEHVKILTSQGFKVLVQPCTR